jgi:peptide/nickel transport system permease protein
VSEQHAVGTGGISLWQDAYRRLRKDRIATLCFLVVVGYVVVALLAKLGTLVNALHADGHLSQGWKDFADAVLFADYDVADGQNEKKGPSWEHWFGTNIHGKDILARIANGAGIAISLGLGAAALAVAIGAMLGALAGWFGGWVDEIVVWLYSTVSSVPDIMLMLGIAYVTPFEGITPIFIAMGLTYWVGVARVVRGEFLRQKERDYVLAARALGLSNARIMVQHVAPNAAHLLIIMFSLLFVEAIKAEVVLAFLGVGVVNDPSWGILIQDAENELMQGKWWQIGFTSAALFGIVLCVQVFTDALRDALDPRLRH